MLVLTFGIDPGFFKTSTIQKVLQVPIVLLISLEGAINV